MAAEPKSSRGPISIYRSPRQLEGGRDFGRGHAREKAHLGDPGPSGVDSGKLLKGIVEIQYLDGSVWAPDKGFIERYHCLTTPAFGRLPGTCVIYENVTHAAGGRGEKVVSVESAALAVLRKPNKCLIN